MHVIRNLRSYPREAFGAFLLLVALASAFVGLAIAPSPPLSGDARANTPPVSRIAALGAPPVPEALQFKDVTTEDARTINAVMPFSGAPNPAARAFKPKFADDLEQARALDCLTAAVYYEAAIEAPDGQRAVAQVVLNRLRHPAYPKTVCGVVFQGAERNTGCQFTFTCDGALARTPQPAMWNRARGIARAALSGYVFAPVGWSTHYHTDWVVPYWASSLAKATQVGTHIFYRWLGGWGRPPAFTGRYAGVEPSVGRLAALSTAHELREDLALAAGDALDQLSSDQLPTDQLSAADASAGSAAPAVPVPGAGLIAGTGRLAADSGAAALGSAATAGVLKADSVRLPWELRWALTGNSEAKPEAAFGKSSETAKATEARSKPVGCVTLPKATSVGVPGSAATILVRERCGV